MFIGAYVVTIRWVVVNGLYGISDELWRFHKSTRQYRGPRMQHTFAANHLRLISLPSSLKAQIQLMLQNASSIIANTSSCHSRMCSSISCSDLPRNHSQYGYVQQRQGLTTPPSSSDPSLSRTSASDNASPNLEPKLTDPRPPWLFTTSSLLRVLVALGGHLMLVIMLVFQCF